MSIARLKALPVNALPALAADIRAFLIDTISKTGGHIGANLATVELSIALHYVFESPDDSILWDTSHQGYTHRILTGRASQFSTLNTFGGMSRFLARSNSPHDIMDASHAGTALSTAVGLAQARRMAGNTHRVIAVVGDGTLGEGETWEALNYLAGADLPVIVVVNDNGMAIAPTVGGGAYRDRGDMRSDDGRPAAWWNALGFPYFCCENGHDIDTMVTCFLDLGRRSYPKYPCIVHIKTIKGHGLPCAASHPYRMHYSTPFDPVTGAGASPTIAGRTYATVAAETLATILATDLDVVVLTPGTPYASALEPLMAQYPDRVLDVGMAEQHAVSMAAGLALGGKKPVVCMQSTFLQRAYDQILHDVCYMDLSVTFLCVRSGFAGYDSPTHHGLWDIPVLRSFPRLQLHYAMDTRDLCDTLTVQLAAPAGPMALLMPYEPIAELEPLVTDRHNGFATFACSFKAGTIWCLGNTLQTALAVRHILTENYHHDFGIVCLGRLVPFPVAQLRETLQPCGGKYITIEEGAGGVAALMRGHLDNPYVSWLHCDTHGMFVPAGSKEECAIWAGLAPMQVVEKIVARWPGLCQREMVSHAILPRIVST